MPKDTPGSFDKLTQRIAAEELSKLLKVSSALASSLELAEVLQIAITNATDLLDLDTGAIYLLEEEALYLGATTPPLPPGFPAGLRLAELKDHPHVEEALKTLSPVHIYDARTASLSPAEQIVVETRHLVSILYFPLLLKESAIGAFIVGTTEKAHPFTKEEIDLCKILSYQISLAVTNAKLYEATQQAISHVTRAYDATLEGWSRMLDIRDHVTEEHTHRVADLTVALAARFGFPESELEHIRRGAILHDIGKMGIPDSILLKPGPLSDDEMAIMKSHPGLGYRLLSRIDYLAPALDIPYCHHERWDGTGYPRKLKGEEIPLSARIFAVVDVFDALTSDRPYRKAWDQERAVGYIQVQSGRHFYPEAVNAFLKMLHDGSCELC